VARSEEVATALVPIVVIPQIILGDVIAPLRGWAESLAEGLISVYWGQQALERLLPEEDLLRVHRETLESDRPFMFVLVHTVVFCLAALIVLRTTRGRGRSH
jgi:hypothetical protein